MKRLFFVALATLAFVSCDKEEKKPEKDYLVLSGKIENFKRRSITLEGHNFQKRIKFDRKTGTFSDTLKNIVPGHYTLVIGKRPVQLYLTELGDTQLTVNAKKRTQAPVYQGINSKINSYLVERRKKFGVILGSANRLFAAKEEEFLAKMDAYKNALIKLAESSELSPEYLEKEKRNINYEYARNLENYQNYHITLTGNEDFKTAKDFPSEIDEIDFNNAEDYANSLSYRSLLKEHLNKVAEENIPKDGDFYLTYLETINGKVTNPVVKNDLMHIVSEKGLTYTTDMHDFYKKYMSYSTDETNKKAITDIYNKLKLTAKGQPSPKFKNYANFDGSRTSLDDLIGKGKYLYIDIWATWCGFCKKEIPLLKNFEIKYHGKNIEFVSISVDTRDNFKKWKKIVEEKEMGGVQLFAGNSHLHLDFTKDYLIKGLPRFILLDPDGNIVTANAPRPSDGNKLDDIFEELGIKPN